MKDSRTNNINKLLNIKDSLAIKPISGWLLGQEFKLVKLRSNLESKLIDKITETTPTVVSYIRLPKDDINSENEVHMQVSYDGKSLTNRKVQVNCGTYAIRVLDVDIVEMYTEYVRSTSDVEIVSRDCREMSPRDSIFRRYEAICGLTTSMKILLTKSMLGEDISLDIKEYTPIGRKFIPNLNRSRIGKLQHSLVYLTDKGLTLTRPDNGYLKVDIRYDKDTIKVYVVDTIGHVVLFDGEAKYINNSFTAKVMRFIIDCPLIASDKVMSLTSKDIVELVEYIHTKSLVILEEGRMTADYIKAVSKFLYRIKTRNFTDMYGIFSRYGVKCDVEDKVVDESYYVNKLSNLYGHLGFDIMQ